MAEPEVWEFDEVFSENKLDPIEPPPLQLNVPESSEGKTFGLKDDTLERVMKETIPEYLGNLTREGSKKQRKNNKKEKRTFKDLPTVTRLPNVNPYDLPNTESISKTIAPPEEDPEQIILSGGSAHYVAANPDNLPNNIPIPPASNISVVQSALVNPRLNETQINDTTVSNASVPNSLVSDETINTQPNTGDKNFNPGDNAESNASLVSGEITNPSQEPSEKTESSSEASDDVVPMNVDQKGLKRQSLIDVTKTEPPLKKNKEMEKYQRFSDTEDENHKMMIYSRIRNFMRHSQRIKGYVELHGREPTLLAGTRKVLVQNSYYGEPNTGDNTAIAKARRKANEDLWTSMILENVPGEDPSGAKANP